jgi:hypothetical protein
VGILSIRKIGTGDFGSGRGGMGFGSGVFFVGGLLILLEVL